jgi:hypothetical protein
MCNLHFLTRSPDEKRRLLRRTQTKPAPGKRSPSSSLSGRAAVQGGRRFATGWNSSRRRRALIEESPPDRWASGGSRVMP